MAAKYKVGDVVVLNSGGELMTVVEADDDEVSVTWQSGGKRHDSTYPVDALRLLPSEDELNLEPD